MSEARPRAARHERPPLLKPGDRLGNFVIRERIGWGGMGDLYKAHDTELQRRVAIKTCGGDGMFTKDPTFLVRFRSEAMAMARVGQENVVQIYQFGVTESGVPFLVMPLLEGEDLSRRLRRLKRPLSVGEAVDIVTDASRGVYACHQVGLIHRDLKPGNLFLTTDARRKRRVTKVLDFGLAVPKPSLDGDAPDRLTSPGIVLGTPGYMAPEQARAEAVDERTDQFALAAILYVCLTGKKPHEHLLSGIRGVDEMRMLITVARQEAPAQRPSSYAEMPAPLEDAIMRALSANPADRFPTVYDFDNAIKDFSTPEAQRYHLDYYASPPEPMAHAQLTAPLVDAAPDPVRPVEIRPSARQAPPTGTPTAPPPPSYTPTVADRTGPAPSYTPTSIDIVVDERADATTADMKRGASTASERARADGVPEPRPDWRSPSPQSALIDTPLAAPHAPAPVQPSPPRRAATTAPARLVAPRPTKPSAPSPAPPRPARRPTRRAAIAAVGATLALAGGFVLHSSAKRRSPSDLSAAPVSALPSATRSALLPTDPPRSPPPPVIALQPLHSAPSLPSPAAEPSQPALKPQKRPRGSAAANSLPHVPTAAATPLAPKHHAHKRVAQMLDRNGIPIPTD